MRPSVAIIAAIPEELTPLLGRLQNLRKCSLGRFPAWSASLAGVDIFVLRSGMGERNAREATTDLLCRMRPAILYSIGFAGAIRPGLAVGDLVLAKNLFTFDGSTAMPVPATSMQQVPVFLGQHRYAGSILSTSNIVNKQAAAAFLPASLPSPVFDMETATIAAIATRENIPLLALRAISDVANMELEFSLNEFCDQNLNVRLWRVLITVARKPWIIPQLLRLATNSRIAGQALAGGVCDLLTHHNQRPRSAAGECG